MGVCPSLALADSEPSDETAFRCCKWIIQRAKTVGNTDRAIFSADQKAWEILAKHHLGRSDLPMLCCNAVLFLGPAQERFLRGLLKRQNLERESAGFSPPWRWQSCFRGGEYIEHLQMRETGSPSDDWIKYVDSRRASDWGKDLVPENAATFKAESIKLFRDVLGRYANVPVTITAPRVRNLKILGEKAREPACAGAFVARFGIARHGRHRLAGPAARPEKLSGSRGGVDVLVYRLWPLHGPDSARAASDQNVRDRPFALLSVCTDAELDSAKKTAAEHKMTWPCWFDGENGPIARDWNVLAWPTVIVLDENGRIIGKDLHGELLDAKVAELMKGK